MYVHVHGVRLEAFHYMYHLLETLGQSSCESCATLCVQMWPCVVNTCGASCGVCIGKGLCVSGYNVASLVVVPCCSSLL